MIAPLTEPKGISFAVLKEMKCSHKLGFYLNSELTPEEAINEYKRAVVKDLSIHIRKRYNIKHRMKTFEVYFVNFFHKDTLNIWTWRMDVHCKGSWRIFLNQFCLHAESEVSLK